MYLILMYVCMYVCYNCYILTHGFVCILLKNDYSAFMIACKNGFSFTAKILLDAGSDISAKNNVRNRHTYVGVQIYVMHFKLISMVYVICYMLCTCLCKSGDTALIIASGKGQLEVVDMLIERKSPINVQNKVRKVLLSIYASYKHRQRCRDVSHCFLVPTLANIFLSIAMNFGAVWHDGSDFCGGERPP